MKLLVSLSLLNGTGALAQIESSGRYSACLDIAGGMRTSQQAACKSAAKALREAADRFELLAQEPQPFHARTHRTVNAARLSKPSIDSSRMRDDAAKSTESHSQKGVSLNTPNNGFSVLSDSGDTSMSDIRKDFETWAKKQYCGFKLSDFIETLGGYMDDPTQCAWLGYQAGRSDRKE